MISPDLRSPSFDWLQLTAEPQSAGIATHRVNVAGRPRLICARPARVPESLDELTRDAHATKFPGCALVYQRPA